MVDFNILKKGDMFYYCCDWYWIGKYKFVKLLKDGGVKCTYAESTIINRKGELSSDINLKCSQQCFLSSNDAWKYQRDFKSGVRRMLKDKIQKNLNKVTMNEFEDYQRLCNR